IELDVTNRGPACLIPNAHIRTPVVRCRDRPQLIACGCRKTRNARNQRANLGIENFYPNREGRLWGILTHAYFGWLLINPSSLRYRERDTGTCAFDIADHRA